MVIAMEPFYELLFRLSKRTDVPKVISLPRDMVVAVNGKKFKLIEKTYVMGVADDLAFVVKHPVSNCLSGLNMAFAALNYNTLTKGANHGRSSTDSRVG